MPKITAALQIINPVTDKVISERIVGEFDSEDAASVAAQHERKFNESIALYGCAENSWDIFDWEDYQREFIN